MGSFKLFSVLPRQQGVSHDVSLPTTTTPPPPGSGPSYAANELSDLKPVDPRSDTGNAALGPALGKLLVAGIGKKRSEEKSAWLGRGESIGRWTGGQCNQGTE